MYGNKKIYYGDLTKIPEQNNEIKDTPNFEERMKQRAIFMLNKYKGEDRDNYEYVEFPENNKKYYFLSEDGESLTEGIYTVSSVENLSYGIKYTYYMDKNPLNKRPILFIKKDTLGGNRRTKRRRTKNLKSKRRNCKKK